MLSSPQIELGTYPTSYIQATGTAAVARAVDALSYADPVADNETRLVKRLVSDPETEVVVDIDDWDYSMPVPTEPTIIQSVTVWAPGERPA